MPVEHLVHGPRMLLGEPPAFGMLIDDVHIAIAIQAAEQDHGVMEKAIIEGSEPLDAAAVVEVINDMDVPAKVGEELAGHDVPFSVEPGLTDPAFLVFEHFPVFLVGILVVVHERLDEAGVRFLLLLPRDDELFLVPGVADAARVGGGIHAGPPGRAIRAELGRAATGADIRILLGTEGGGFLDSDHVVFEADMIIQILLVPEMLGDDARAVAEDDFAFADLEFVRDTPEDNAAQILEMFEVGLGGLAQEEAFEVGDALAIIQAHLGEHPERFTTATSAAESDGNGAIGKIALTGRATGGELFVLECDSGLEEVFDLRFRAAEAEGSFEIGIDGEHKISFLPGARGLSRWYPGQVGRAIQRHPAS